MSTGVLEVKVTIEKHVRVCMKVIMEMHTDLEYLNSNMLNFDDCAELTTENKDFDIIRPEYWKTLIFHHFGSENLQSHFADLKHEEKDDFFKYGIMCISKFVQANFTGPELDTDTVKFLKDDFISEIDYNQILAVNNEDMNVNTKYPCLLVAAQCIFRNCQLNTLLNVWWQWRANLVHQKILDELSPTLLSNAESLQKDIKDLNLTGNLKAQFEIEQAQLYCEFRSIGKADAHIKDACEILGLKYELAGRLGKRTKHQDKDLAQLTLEVSLVDKSDIEREPVKTTSVPTIITLDDDIRLDAIKFADESKEVYLPDLEQKLLLVITQHMIISKPRDDLFYEELKPFIDLILSQNNTWCVRSCTLLLRCQLEAKHKRTIERSLPQCEAILKAFAESEPHFLNRVGGVYTTGLSPIWKAKEQYADVMLNLGLIKASLEQYLELQLWEEVIVCYTILKMRHKAAEVVKLQLKVKPTVKLYCLLGDATDDVFCYEKAWEFSKKRSHRAQRHWGQYYFMRKKYAECIPHFEKSVSINPLQAVIWLRLGFAALETQNWQLAATAYRRYTTLEPDGFEAWNNLAQAYLRLGNKRNAHHALQDALRCNFDNWKVWQNFLVVSADISSYSDAIRAYHKLLDIKEKYLNVDALKVLVYAVLNEPVVEDDNKSLMKRTRELLGRVTAIYPGEGVLWELYASLAPIPLLKIQRLQRAYRGFTQGAWTKDTNTCQHALYICLKLGEAVLDDAISPKDVVINSVKLNINSTLSAMKMSEFTETEMLQKEVAGVLSKIIEKVNSVS